MRKIVESQYYDKIGLLEDQLNGLEFKFDLVMTKCKLGVANNSNKISTLENLLEFTNLIKWQLFISFFLILLTYSHLINIQ